MKQSRFILLNATAFLLVSLSPALAQTTVQQMDNQLAPSPNAAALDRCLDEHGYIRPGLGDAGDRLFGTK